MVLLGPRTDHEFLVPIRLPSVERLGQILRRQLPSQFQTAEELESAQAMVLRKGIALPQGLHGGHLRARHSQNSRRLSPSTHSQATATTAKSQRPVRGVWSISEMCVEMPLSSRQSNVG